MSVNNNFINFFIIFALALPLALKIKSDLDFWCKLDANSLACFFFISDGWHPKFLLTDLYVGKKKKRVKLCHKYWNIFRNGRNVGKQSIIFSWLTFMHTRYWFSKTWVSFQHVCISNNLFEIKYKWKLDKILKCLFVQLFYYIVVVTRIFC